MTEPVNIGPRSLGATLGPLENGVMGEAMRAFGLAAVDWEKGHKLFGFGRGKDRETGKWGFDVWLWVDHHGMNLTCYGIAPFERRLADAKQWAIDFAKAHGFVAMQRGKRPKQKPRPKLTVLEGGKL